LKNKKIKIIFFISKKLNNFFFPSKEMNKYFLKEILPCKGLA
jgi:hypothetical protein